MLYDCFTFFDEFDLLEIRLNYLSDIVDKFVLVEMGQTFSGNEKPFYYEENKSRYEKFADKIIHVKVEDYPFVDNLSEYDKCWCRENYQRDCILRGLNNAEDDDIIMISDVDEIPSKNAINSYNNGIYGMRQRCMSYYLNCEKVSDLKWDKGTKICEMEILLYPGFDIEEEIGARYTQKGFPTYVRFYTGPVLLNGGWHFSYLGGSEAISKKIKSFSHQEFNNETYTDEKEIERKILAGEDLFGRGDVYKAIPIDETFPDYIVNNQEKYKHLILPVK
ncbi:hypothetical protein IJI31_00485 [bacterium]|nr:hypothetical protein [bacterium]